MDEEDDSDTKSDSSDEDIAEPQDQMVLALVKDSLGASEAFSHTSSQLLASSLELNELLPKSATWIQIHLPCTPRRQVHAMD